MANLPIIRISWLLFSIWIIVPAQINNKALNKACVIKWKNLIVGCSNPNATIMIPNCLRVDKAMIFFKSFSKIAADLAIKQVIVPR